MFIERIIVNLTMNSRELAHIWRRFKSHFSVCYASEENGSAKEEGEDESSTGCIW